ncbi:XRE family transcriptional regulator [bacterium 1xD8-48]|nr:XRE family transcriptional regulator [bacterium 1xD8-48]
MTAGENIKRIRKEKGLTQKQLGELCGMNEVQIRRYELGGANPKFETVAKIAKALGTTPFVLYDGPEAPARLEQAVKESAYLIQPDELEHDLLDAFWELNDKGAETALERVKELTEIPRYTQREE